MTAQCAADRISVSVPPSLSLLPSLAPSPSLLLSFSPSLPLSLSPSLPPVQVRLDGKLVAAAAVPNPFIKKAPKDGLLMLEVGHFTGLLDELRISTSAR